MWRNRFGGGFEPVVRQNIEWICRGVHVCSVTSQMIRSTGNKNCQSASSSYNVITSRRVSAHVMSHQWGKDTKKCTVENASSISKYLSSVMRSQITYHRKLNINRNWCRSQYSSGLRRRSRAARLLRSWVRIPPGEWMFVCCVCCVLSGRGLCDGLIIRSEESYRLWRVSVCDQVTSYARRLKPYRRL